MRFNTSARYVHELILDDGSRLELKFAPYDDPLVERVGNKLVVAYLAHDDCPSNPMEDFDCQGKIVTHAAGGRSGLITDDEGALRRELRLGGWNSEPDIDHEFKLAGASTTLRDLAADVVFREVLGSEDDTQAFMDHAGWVLDEGETLAQAFAFSGERWLRDDLYKDLVDSNGCFSDRVEALALELYRTHWKAVIGPLVIPMYYSHCGYDTTISVHDWDGDWDDLPNCVWVADKGAEENIRASCRPDNVDITQVEPYPESVYAVTVDGAEVARGTFSEASNWIKAHYPPNDTDLRATAVRYAESVCEGYAKWASGEVYGCVLQTFELQNPDNDGSDDEVWEEVGDWDSCCGLIGLDHAQEALKSDYFDPAIARLKKGVTA